MNPFQDFGLWLVGLLMLLAGVAYALHKYSVVRAMLGTGRTSEVERRAARLQHLREGEPSLEDRIADDLALTLRPEPDFRSAATDAEPPAPTH